MSLEMGSILRMTLEKKNMSRKELSQKTGLSESTLSRFISGERGVKVSLDVMSRLAAALDIPLLNFVNRSGFSFASETLLSIADTEGIVNKMIQPTLARIALDDEYVRGLFVVISEYLEPDDARKRLFSMSATDQFKLLAANGFDISIIDDTDPNGCMEFRITPPKKYRMPEHMLRMIAKEEGTEYHPPVSAQDYSDRRVRVRLEEGSIFQGHSEKLQAFIAKLDQMDPEIAEKTLRQIETTAELFPKKPAPKIIDNNP